MLAFNEDAGVALAPIWAQRIRAWRSPTSAARCSPRTAADMPIAGGRRRPRLGRRALPCAAARGGPGRRRRARNRDRSAGPGRARDRQARNPPTARRDGYPIPERFADRYRVPVLVDNDVNIMALGEHWTTWAGVDHLLFIKVGTGIGCGIVVAGRILRGTEGAAGEIGHIRVAAGDEADAIVCSCGNGLPRGAGGRWGDGRKAARPGLDAADSRTVVELARAGEPAAVRLVRESGRLIGEVLAASVNLYNPSVIVIGGDVAQAHEQLLAGVREVVYQRSLPLATPPPARRPQPARRPRRRHRGRGDGDRADALAGGDRRRDRRARAARSRAVPEGPRPEGRRARSRRSEPPRRR